MRKSGLHPKNFTPLCKKNHFQVPKRESSLSNIYKKKMEVNISMTQEQFTLLVNLYIELQKDISHLEKKIQESLQKLKALGITIEE